MSDFEIVGKDAEIDMCYGLEKFCVTKEGIAALLSGKKLYSTVNCGEYAITIEMAESEDDMTDNELYMRKLVRESDVIDKTDGSELAQAFNTLWDKYVEAEFCWDAVSRKDVREMLFWKKVDMGDALYERLDDIAKRLHTVRTLQDTEVEPYR